MFTLSYFLIFLHLLGLALGVGAATIKMVLLFKCNYDYQFASDLVKVTKPVTRLILWGLILVTLSGIGWLFAGYSFTPLLIVKVVLVGLIWVVGPFIDNVESKFAKLVPVKGGNASVEFIKIQKRYLVLEFIADALFYAIIVMGVFI